MGTPGKRLAALGATVLVVALAVGSAAPEPTAASPAFPPVRPTRVLVLGDSVMKGAVAQYAAKLPGREVVVDAEVNRSTRQGADVVNRLGTDWDVVVVLLAHNDGGSPAVYQPAVRSILDQLRGVRRVSWLTIHAVRPYYPDVNHFIAGLQGAYPNLRIGDWNAVAAARPEAVAGDGLHLTGTGADLLSDLVAEQVQGAELEWNADLVKLAQATTTTTTTAPPTTTTTTTAPPTTTTSTSTSTTTSELASTTTAPRSTTSSDCRGDQGGATCEPLAPPATDSEMPAAALFAGIIAIGLGGGWLLARRSRSRGRTD